MTWVQSLGQEDPLEKEMATHSSILAWEIPWTEEPGGLQSMGLQKSWTGLKRLSSSGKIKSVTVSPRICREVMGPDSLILSFLNVEL